MYCLAWNIRSQALASGLKDLKRVIISADHYKVTLLNQLLFLLYPTDHILDLGIKKSLPDDGLKKMINFYRFIFAELQ